MSALPCKSRKVEHFSGEHTAGVPRVYKTFSLILEKYPTLSRVWVGKYGPRIAESARALCVFPDRRVSAFWRKAQKRFKRQCSLPKHVTKWGKVLISVKLFCQRTRVRGRASTRASVEKNGLMSRFFARFCQNFASRAPLKTAAPRVAAHIRN